jgi:hypothetical protein
MYSLFVGMLLFLDNPTNSNGGQRSSRHFGGGKEGNWIVSPTNALALAGILVCWGESWNENGKLFTIFTEQVFPPLMVSLGFLYLCNYACSLNLRRRARHKKRQRDSSVRRRRDKLLKVGLI